MLSATERQTFHWESARGALDITILSPSVMLFVYKGHLDGSVAPFVEETVDRVISTGHRPRMFVDYEQMTGYESSYRAELTKWALRKKKHFGALAVLLKFRSKLMSMAFEVSNMALGGWLSSYNDRRKFEVAIAAAIREDRPERA